MRVNLNTLGCRLNEAETENWAQQFQASGHQIVRDPQHADLIVLNSCAVTKEATRKSRQMIRRLHRGNPTAKLVVSGCYATLNSEEVASSLGVDLVIDNKDKDRLVELTGIQLVPKTPSSSATEPGETSLFKRGRQRAFIKVQDGCRYRCTFCVVTVARGAEKSRLAQDIINQINTLHQQGVHEVILTGVHLGGYGADIDTDLDTLISKILRHTQMPRIRLGSLEPWDLPKSFFELFDNPRLMPHLHLPLQSGSDPVLRRMARRCKTEQFARMVDQARREIPDINITTDMIVGFPGETDQEWSESLATLERIGFGHIHIFTYSPRPGTKAALMPDQVPLSIRKERSKTLHQLARSLKNETFGRFLGREFPVLWESRIDKDAENPAKIFGYTPNFLRVGLSGSLSLENKIKTARLRAIARCGVHVLADPGG